MLAQVCRGCVLSHETQTSRSVARTSPPRPTPPEGRYHLEMVYLLGIVPEAERLCENLLPLRERLTAHVVYGRLRTLEALRTFMEHHVFAVWDFMSLLKSLQQRFTSVVIPWLPVGDPATRRLVNELVLAEETDELGEGGYASHFELYLEVMREAGANRTAIDGFIARLRAGAALPAIAAAFTIGREEVIPELFRALLRDLGARFPGRVDKLHDYLDRHVRLDQESHAPLSLRMLSIVCADDRGRWAEAEVAARQSLEARLELWNGIAEAIGIGPGTRRAERDHGPG